MTGELLGWMALCVATLSLIIVLIRAWAEHRRWQRFQDTIRGVERRQQGEDEPQG